MSTTFAVAGLLGVEVVVRSWESRHPGAVGLEALHRYSERYGWEPRPGARVLQSGKWVSVNRAGYRGSEVPLRGDGRALRVVLLGDSITFGLEVGDEETFAQRLHGDPRFEVVNLAVDGYGPGQSLLRLEREGLRFAPDVVVMNVCLENDFADAVSPTFLYDGSHPKPYFRLERGELVLHDRQLRLSSRERLGLLLREQSRALGALTALLVRAPAPAHWLDRREAALRDPGAEALTVALVSRMRARAAGAGAAFLVALHPGRDSLRRRSHWAKALIGAPGLRGSPVIEMREEYRARGRDAGSLIMDHVGHLTADGHRAAAAVLAEALVRAGLARGGHRSY